MQLVLWKELLKEGNNFFLEKTKQNKNYSSWLYPPVPTPAGCLMVQAATSKSIYFWSSSLEDRETVLI